MERRRHIRLGLVLLALALLLIGATGDERAMALAEKVVRASGGEHWPTVTRIKFTFNVEQDGQMTVSAKHDWDVTAGTDTVTWNGKTVTVNLMNPGDGEDQKAAFQRWTNDSYWLLAPLKLKDGGVMLTHKGTQEKDGQTCEVLHVKFDGVGLTPSDQYNLYIDPQTHLVRAWDYMPSPDRTVTGTWDEYKDFNGLTLSTNYNFGGRRVYFTDVAVERK